MKYKRIMVAVDRSNISNLALKEAIQLTKDLGSILRVIHVVDENIVQFSDGFVDVNNLWAAYKEEAQEYMQKLNRDIKEEYIQFETHLVVLKTLEGHLPEKIIKEAEEWKADLLVIGTHGRRGFSRFFLGSIAEKLLRIATLPILLIRGNSNKRV
ncbi:universal stress protein [Legionella parisiensis]|uniref:Universal stress protein n=1 Tax=Legionella parisiensis TaxID=45071 RepID=A0A1E5JW05_9GAMM|nr:universal stress protein [Legionella parisiensis]KTD40579.1 universal stress protein [Legionella parisiensis]OEH48726.1 putative universal stress protein [Legionella parisiensis]STX77028.1 universal stress protein [Legionella parisiensis]